jgi:hypothetical protein
MACRKEGWFSGLDWFGGDDGKTKCSDVDAGKSLSKCSWIKFKGYLNITEKVRYNQLYEFELLNCNRTRIHVQFYYEFLNPHNEQLGWNYFLLPYIFAILLFIYSITGLVWLGNIIVTQMGAGSNTLHKLISFWPLVKIFVVAYNLGFWEYLSDKGVISWFIVLIYAVFNGFWITYVFFVILMIALGYGITRKSITMAEAFFLGIILVCHYIAMVLNYGLEGVFVLPCIFSYFGLMMFIIFCMRLAIAELERATARAKNIAPSSHSPKIDELRFERACPSRKDQLILLRRLLFALPFYAFGLMVFAGTYVFLLPNLDWLYRLGNELAELWILSVLMFIFRLRKRNLYFEFNDQLMQGNESQSSEGTLEFHSPSGDDDIEATENAVEMSSVPITPRTEVDDDDGFGEDDEEEKHQTVTKIGPSSAGYSVPQTLRVTPGLPPGTVVPTGQIIFIDSVEQSKQQPSAPPQSLGQQKLSDLDPKSASSDSPAPSTTPAAAPSPSTPAPKSDSAKGQTKQPKEVRVEEASVSRIRGTRGQGPATLRKPREFDYDSTQGYWAVQTANDQIQKETTDS